MSRKNNLDEMQEQKLLKIESKGFWLAFWALFTSLAVQMIIYGAGEGTKYMAAEWIVFMLISLYVAGACLKDGIWDRHLQPTPKDNILISLVAGVISGALMFARVFRNYPTKIAGSIASGVFIGVVVFVLCFVIMTISANAYVKKMKKLEEEPEEDLVESVPEASEDK